MAKKSRRIRKQGRQVRLSRSQMVGIDPGIATTSNEVPSPDGTSGAPSLQEEYRYVINDLKRIGILAVVMLALLVALAVFLT